MIDYMCMCKQSLTIIHILIYANLRGFGTGMGGLAYTSTPTGAHIFSLIVWPGGPGANTPAHPGTPDTAMSQMGLLVPVVVRDTCDSQHMMSGSYNLRIDEIPSCITSAQNLAPSTHATPHECLQLPHLLGKLDSAPVCH